MKNVKSILIGTGSVALAGLILTLVVPRAAHAIVATAVLVENTTASPVPNKDVDQPGRHAFTQSCAVPINSSTCSMQPPVPAGNVFVVQTITADQLLASATNPASLFYSTTTNAVTTQVDLPANGEYNFPQHALTLANVTLYQDAGTTPGCGAPQVSTVLQSCYASGYLVTIP